jgi:hypothetical protein
VYQDPVHLYSYTTGHRLRSDYLTLVHHTSAAYKVANFVIRSTALVRRRGARLVLVRIGTNAGLL